MIFYESNVLSVLIGKYLWNSWKMPPISSIENSEICTKIHVEVCTGDHFCRDGHFC